eukprot:361965-Chlamydomonas_euryale.AAC.2
MGGAYLGGVHGRCISGWGAWEVRIWVGCMGGAEGRLVLKWRGGRAEMRKGRDAGGQRRKGREAEGRRGGRAEAGGQRGGTTETRKDRESGGQRGGTKEGRKDRGGRAMAYGRDMGALLQDFDTCSNCSTYLARAGARNG